jgi:hypothetical protein
MSDIYVGQSSLRIQLTCGQDITGALSLKIKYLKPNGVTGEWVATDGGTATGIIYYDVVLATEIDVPGVWTFWSYVKFSDGREGYGDPITQDVVSNIAGTVTPGTNSWVTMAEAEIFFLSRFGSDEYWTETTDKVGAILTAYKWLLNCPRFSLAASASAATVLKDAQCEMALFLIQHQPDIDLRMGLQAQGVREAGIVKEKYDGKNRMPIPPFVVAMLDAYRADTPMHIINIERDEEQNVSYDAPGNLETADDTTLT